jgi:hypothetical protein
MNIKFPDYYDDFAEFEHESKGYLSDVTVEANGVFYSFDFYDLGRLLQDANEEIGMGNNYFRINSAIVVGRVNRAEIIRVLRLIFGG